MAESYFGQVNDDWFSLKLWLCVWKDSKKEDRKPDEWYTIVTFINICTPVYRPLIKWPFWNDYTVKLKIGSYEVFVPHMGDFSQTSSEPLVYS